MPGEASVAVMVLAVDVARDRAAERDVARAGDHRERQAVARQAREQLRDRRAGLRREQPLLESIEMMRSSAVRSSTVPPAFWAASP